MTTRHIGLVVKRSYTVTTNWYVVDTPTLKEAYLVAEAMCAMELPPGVERRWLPTVWGGSIWHEYRGDPELL